LKTTAIGFVALALVVIGRRLIEGFPPSEFLHIINLATIFVLCLIIVVIARAWLPGRG
jgi:uncharacterized membrane protein required for colicin V production